VIQSPVGACLSTNFVAKLAFWDKIPISRRLDWHLKYRFGKSVLALRKTTPLTSRGDRSAR
jgi:hypothetical protein